MLIAMQADAFEPWHTPQLIGGDDFGEIIQCTIHHTTLVIRKDARSLPDVAPTPLTPVLTFLSTAFEHVVLLAMVHISIKCG